LSTGPVAARNRIRLLLLGKEADIVVKTSSVKFDNETPNFTDDSSFLSQKVKCQKALCDHIFKYKLIYALI